MASPNDQPIDCNTGDEMLDQKIKEWLRYDQNVKTRTEILNLLQDKQYDELKGRLMNRLSFGTAGLRAKMGAGYNRLNDLTIIQSTQGFCRYLQQSFPEIKEGGVVIGFDARYNSHRFAQLTAGIFRHQGIRTYLFSKIVPTPFVAFGVRYLKCCAGIMITASHNPKEDNGYKVYWNNGAQIIPPHDVNIKNLITNNMEPWADSWDTEIVNSAIDPYDEVYQEYFSIIKKRFHYGANATSESKIGIVYSAMHGVGCKFSKESFRAFSLPDFHEVKEQCEPDPEFPTVKYPNPEEGRGALELSIKTAKEKNCTIILANDPDADRLAVAEQQSDGTWKILSGNEIGALLGWWSYYTFKQSDHSKTFQDSNVYMLSSTVSSTILGAIALVEGINFEDTLTGFKWMGNRSDQLMQDGKRVLFAFEEAIGFMCDTFVLDKDGVHAAAVVGDMARYLADNGLTINDQLERIWERYGRHVAVTSYFLCYSQPTIEKIFSRLRNYDGDNKYPAACGSFKIKYVRDLTTGYDSSQPDLKALLPSSASSQMITFSFENGCIATLRTSGTEPKLKYYVELKSQPGVKVSEEDVKALLADIISALVDNFLQPELNGLIARE
ncbi:Phosphoglucomutase-2 [Trichoplax sp. H2]|nr:Phosphoglucomutase-2 [Trichoplax sp. H2]|eukprot:RDD39478.1 Phosphoglucomutase-2 [Trichoplax sp. H2]